MTIENNRLTHQLLAKYLALDPFSELFAEANESAVNLGKIRVHVFSELCLDIIPNFAYNTGTRRFVRPLQAPTFVDPVNRENHMAMPSANRFGSKVGPVGLLPAAVKHIRAV
jgi:cytoplasmic FMR1 interacting protein